MKLHLADYVIWFAAPALQLGVLVAMYRRGLYRHYPYFFSYTVLQILSEPILFAANRQSYSAYYYGYWAAAALSILASIAVLQELFKNGFQTDGTVARLSGILLVSTLVIIVAAEMRIMPPNNWGQDLTWIDLIILINRTVHLAQCGLLVFVFFFRKRLGISRRSVLFGITVGFGLFATVSMLAAMLMPHPVLYHAATLYHIGRAAYLVACLIWLAYTMVGSNGERGYSWKRVVPL